MKINMFLNTRAFALLLALLAPAPAFADATGLWRVADGTAIIRISRCGKALCGVLAKAAAPEPGQKPLIGGKILVDMRPQGDKWVGAIHDLENDKVYDGEIALESENQLRVKGCLSGGGFCGGESWTRER